MERLIAERLVKRRMKHLKEAASPTTNYYKEVEDLLNHRLYSYETGVTVDDIQELSRTSDTVTLRVEYTVTVRIPMEDHEDGRTYYETEDEFRSQIITLDLNDIDEDVDYEDVLSKVEAIARKDHGNVRNVEYVSTRSGYELYRCVGPDNKGRWYAVKDEDITPISYAQARGEEDIAPTGINKLRKEISKKLMPRSLGEDLSLDDDPEETEQKYSSAATSINSSKLPALFNMVTFEKGSLNLDYGGGRFDNVAEFLESKYGATNLVYDKYNRTSEHNRAVLETVRKNGGADTVTCSNVLNVIAEESERMAVLRNCKRFLKPGGTCYITVYEGSGTGVGAETKAGYQMNRKTKDYEEEIKTAFSTVTRKGKLFICK